MIELKKTIVVVITAAVCALARAGPANAWPIVLPGSLVWNSRTMVQIGGGPLWANRNRERSGVADSSSPLTGMSGIRIAVDEASRLYNIAPELIMAVIRRESQFNPRAVGTSGERGLMQLAPATGRAMGVRDPFDIRENIMGGTKYLAQLFERFQGDYVAGLAAYNVGPAAVHASGGFPPSLRAVDYVRAVLGLVGGGAPSGSTPEAAPRRPEGIRP